jgi:hypothetical protein
MSRYQKLAIGKRAKEQHLSKVFADTISGVFDSALWLAHPNASPTVDTRDL